MKKSILLFAVLVLLRGDYSRAALQLGIRDFLLHAPSPNRSIENGPLNDRLVVSAAVDGFVDGRTNVLLFYRIQFGAEKSVPMTRDDGDVFSAEIPLGSVAAGQMVRWRMQVSEADMVVAAPDPAGGGVYAGTVARLPRGSTNLPVLHWFAENPSMAASRAGTRGSVFYLGEFYDNVFVRIRGSSTQRLPKKSYKIDFNKGHHFRFDPALRRVSEINLNSTYSDKAYIRQSLAADFYGRSGVPTPITFPLRLQLNGEFHSVAMFVEQPDHDFLIRNGLDKDGALYKMYNSFTEYGRADKKSRKEEDNGDLLAFIASVNRLSGAALERYVFDNVNVPAMLDYHAATILMQNGDVSVKNYYVYRDSNRSKEWLIVPWDMDLTFGKHWMVDRSILSDTLVADVDSMGSFLGSGGSASHPFSGTREFPPQRNYNQLTDSLFEVPRFKEMYRRRLRTLMDEMLAPGKVEKQLAEWESLIGADAERDRLKWGQYGIRQSFHEALTALKTDYFDVRREHLFVTHLAANAAKFNIRGSYSAMLPGAQVGSPPVEFGKVEAAPISGDQDEEFIELRNSNAFAVDISGWRLDGGVSHVFAAGTVIPAGGSLYVSPKVQVFRARKVSPHGGEGLFVQGNYVGHLKAGEVVRLFDGGGVEVGTWR